MSDKGFAHLHLHTQYSLLDGAVQPAKLFERCKELNMDQVAITDHGNMFGAIDFYTQAKKAGIKPIIGIEAYIAPESRFDKQKGKIKDSSYHLILLAQNITGYRNLLKLTSAGYTEGFYYRPRIDMELLEQLNEGLICTSACISGQIASLLAGDNTKAAEQAAAGFLNIFGPERYYLEIQHHHDSDMPDVTPAIIDLAKKMGIGLVATNDVHFLNEGDHVAHDVLCCISTGKKFNDEQRMHYPEDVFLKSSDQMRALFPQAPEACDNTVEIANRCDIELDLTATHAPVFHPPSKMSAEDYLTKLVYEGAKERYGKITDQIKERIDRELEVIEGKGFSSYFLIVWDFCNYARENKIPVGARGSAVGTVVGYCLGICDIDPVRYDLLFERFMDPQRNEMPDIDIDICQDNRPRILEYVRKKYGQIAQIITFGTMKARAVIRDVCRVLDVPLAEADRLAKLVPTDLKMTLDKALEAEPELRQAYDSDDVTRQVIDIGKKLEGLARHASVHACGVVIADEQLTNYLPLCTVKNSDDLVTQFEGPTVEKVGLLKMDFLGLKTLSIINRAVQLVEQTFDKKVEIEKVDITDQKVYSEIFASGRTKGVFQFESGGMQDMLMKLKPDRLEDLIAANALYRPGPMALIPDYIDRKHGGKWSVPHEIMKSVLEETFGIMVYQEQVMRICNRLGDIPLREAYTLIKAIGKKKHDIIKREKKRFIQGCVKKNLQKEQAEHIFELIERFAGYGFNKSHATRYSFIAYQTAFLKAYYPVHFMAALLSYEMGDTDKVVDYIAECKAMGIEVMSPDINESFADFTVVFDADHEHHEPAGHIRFGLAAVKGVGIKAVEQIIAAREKVGQFNNLFHFCEVVDLRAVNKQVLESLIKAGAFDNLGGSRAQMMAAMESAMQAGASLQADIQKGQMNLFGASGSAALSQPEAKIDLPEVEPWSEMQMLTYEKDVLGFYVTSNPLSKHAETISAYSTCNTSQLNASMENREVTIGGMITKIRQIITKKGKNAGSKMAVFTLEDLQSDCEAVMFPKTLSEYNELVEVDKIVFVRGKVDCRREQPNIICEELISIENAADVLAANLWIDIPSSEITAEKLQAVKNACQSAPGKSPVRFSVTTGQGYRINAVADKKIKVRADAQLRKRLEDVLGSAKVSYRRN